MKNLLFALLMLLVGVSGARAETFQLDPSCNYFVREDGKWKKISASEIGATAVNASPNAKNPDFFQFLVAGRAYSGKSKCFLAPGSEEGQGQPRNSARPRRPKREFFGGLGLSFSAKESHEVSLAGTTSPYEGTGASRLIFGGEFRFHVADPFFLSAISEFGSYKNVDEADAVSLLSVLAMPGVSFGDSIRPWAGIAAGITVLMLKGGTASSGGVTITLPDESLLALTFSPRAGVTIPLSENLSLDVLAAYQMINNAKWTGTASSGGTNFDLTDQFSLKYLQAMARVGLSF